MPKVKGPLLSLKAQGSLSKTLIFRNHKSGTVVTQWNKPTDPASDTQKTNRTKMRFVRSLWSSLPDNLKQHFNDKGKIYANIPGYNFFIQQYFAGKFADDWLYYDLAFYNTLYYQ